MTRLLLLLLALAPSLTSTAAPLAYRLLDTQPAANFRQVPLQQMSELLQDDVTDTGTMWKSAASVGWHRATPVTLRMKLPAEADRATLVIRFHAARYAAANIHAPRRIDVYRGAGSSSVRYVATARTDRDEQPASGSRWLSAELGGSGRYLTIVIHAARTSIFIDEITVSSTNDVVSPPRSATTVMSDARHDSIERLRAQIAEPVCSSASLPRSLAARFVDPFSLEPLLAPDHQQMYARTGAVAYFAIELRSPAETKLRLPPTASGERVDWWIARPVMASDGSMPVDALEPLSSAEVAIPAGCPHYLLGAIHVGSSDILLPLELPGGAHPQRLTLQVNSFPVTPAPEPAINPYIYMSHATPPVSAGTMVESACADGANVVIMSRDRIPQPTTDGSWDAAGAQRLAADISKLCPHAQLLLALGWQESIAPAALRIASGSSRRELLQRWLQRLTAQLETLGIPSSRWALYVVDEPRMIDREWVARVLTDLTEASPQTRKYITLADVPDAAVGRAWIDTAARTGTLLQVKLQDLRRLAPDMRSQLSQWWAYVVPSEPAKAAHPLREYRLASWLAWAGGASGIGVWAYADRRGSSSWDDLDGVTSDWSLVYERNDGSSWPSRRWAAFLAGSEDLRLLLAADRSALSNVTCRRTLDQLRAPDSPLPRSTAQRLEQHRRSVIDACLRVIAP